MPKLNKYSFAAFAAPALFSIVVAACANGTQTASDTGASGGMTASAGSGQCAPQELCNGVDDNCDGRVDEGCACKAGDTQECWSGDPTLKGVGACKAGKQTCDDQGRWGGCQGEVVQTKEVCNGVDDDCNGLVDEDMGTVTCGLGICKATVEACKNGVPVPCIPTKPEPKEICNGFDNNCDGQVGEGCTCTNGDTQKCYTGSKDTENVGACKDGSQKCGDGQWGTCTGDVTPTKEKCNGVDDDCDGVPDNGDPDSGAACTTGLKGICAAGQQHCEGGKLVCKELMPKGTESCNGLDDDCDGTVDNGIASKACTTGKFGACSPGTTACQGGQTVCVQTNQPSAEICNAQDEDCDGVVDNGNPGGGQACATGQKGVCGPGTTACSAGKIVCNQNVMASAEKCNGIDEDCDGVVDNGNPGGGLGCNTGLKGVCAAGTTACTAGQVVCNQNVAASAEAPANCTDAKDNDCNGVQDAADGGCTCGHALCATGAKLFSGCATNAATNKCVQDICAADAFCCANTWDALCITEVRTICKSLTCAESAGACPAAPCTAGASAYPNNCDSAKANCVAQVCAKDSYCCSFVWDALCVNEVATFCASNCNYP